MDLYADQVDFNVFNKRRENALDVRRTELNTIWNSARVRPDALLIGTDASVPKDKHFQVVAAYCWEGLDDYELEPGRVLAGRVLSTDAELTAIRFALCRAVLRPGCNRIVLFTDSIAIARNVDFAKFAVDSSGYGASIHGAKDKNPKDLRYEALKAEGYKVLEWDGSQTMVVESLDEKLLPVICVGRPSDDSYMDAVREVHGLFIQVGKGGNWKGSDLCHKRGRKFPVINVGNGVGTGNPPYNQRNPGHEAEAKVLLESQALRRLAVHQSEAFKSMVPRVYDEYHAKTVEFRSNTSVRPNWDQSIFSSAACNLGPRVATVFHRDCKNLPGGFCAIHALGDFDHTKGGHLVLKELKLIIQFPAGAMILIPSAMITHGNTPVQLHETRTSFTQYTSGSVFRWVDNGCRTESAFKVADPAGYEQKMKEKATRWKNGLKLWSTVEELLTGKYVCFESTRPHEQLQLFASSTMEQFKMLKDLPSLRKTTYRCGRFTRGKTTSLGEDEAQPAHHFHLDRHFLEGSKHRTYVQKRYGHGDTTLSKRVMGEVGLNVDGSWEPAENFQPGPGSILEFWAFSRYSERTGCWTVDDERRGQFLDRSAQLTARHLLDDDGADPTPINPACIALPPSKIGFDKSTEERFHFVAEMLNKANGEAGMSGEQLYKRIKKDRKERNEGELENECLFCFNQHESQDILLSCNCRFRSYSDGCLNEWVWSKYKNELDLGPPRSSWTSVSCPLCRSYVLPVHREWVEYSEEEGSQRQKAYKAAQKARKLAKKKTPEGRRKERVRRRDQERRKKGLL
ncbi:hypothetical protein NMY22_g17177 [Coprinellus aureogranulatus]|nr:hypothetical protein NMY22_g17177 [Coprinellus aureogranulatus]